jgi:hypothetical protein
MLTGVGGIMGRVDGTAVVMSARVAGSSCGRVAEQYVGRHLKPCRMVIAVAVKHRRSRKRLHRQSQQEQGDSETADAFTHEKSIARRYGGLFLHHIATPLDFYGHKYDFSMYGKRLTNASSDERIVMCDQG